MFIITVIVIQLYSIYETLTIKSCIWINTFGYIDADTYIHLRTHTHTHTRTHILIYISSGLIGREMVKCYKFVVR